MVLVGVLTLAVANGANDVPKGVATLAGSGMTGYHTAVAWGAATTVVGAVASVWLAGSMAALFSSGIVDERPTSGFSFAVLAGAGTWVVLATVRRLPVSTTHAILGALIGAGLLLDAGAVRWSTLASKVAVPLLVSAVVAFGVSGLLALTAARMPARTVRRYRRQRACTQEDPHRVRVLGC
ncbi:inorganic phosphate transporter [Streptomyces scabichelini]|nr:inorganic phosphate transporter [Streptomyces scabichelini]